MKYRKRPTVVEAIQYYDNTREILLWMTDNGLARPHWVLTNETLGILPLSWVIKEDDKIYVCSPDVFEKCFEKIEGESNV